MDFRQPPLVTGHYYHVLNRGINHGTTFYSKREFNRALACLNYYLYAKPEIKYSYFIKISREGRENFALNLKNNHPKLVDIICYCLMPNHFHLLLKQNVDGGISRFMSNFQNSYTKYFNTKNERDGPLFKGVYRRVLVETGQQLLHVSRYIHLNPYTSAITSSYHDLPSYSWSSFSEYLGKMDKSFCICDTDIVLSQFKNSEEYKKFVYANADYQRQLKVIKDLILE